MKRIWIGFIFLLLMAGSFLYVYRDSESLEVAAVKTAEVIAGRGMMNLVRDSVEHPVVALTFDDGLSPKYTPELLDGLKKRGIKASFFLLGKNIEDNRDLVERMEEEGHLIGNHTYNHVKLDELSETCAKQEILKTNNKIYEVTGKYPQYMRPPYGAWKKNLELGVEMLPVFWDIDTLDWKVQNAETVIKTVFREVEDGSVILMHDEYPSTVEAALSVADELQKKGYEFVTVDQLILP